MASFFPGTSSRLFGYTSADTVCYKLDNLSAAVELLNAPDFERLREETELGVSYSGTASVRLSSLLLAQGSAERTARVAEETEAYGDAFEHYYETTRKQPSYVPPPKAMGTETDRIKELIAGHAALVKAYKPIAEAEDVWRKWYSGFRQWFSAFYPDCAPLSFVSDEQVRQLDAKEQEFLSWRKTYSQLTGTDPSNPYTPPPIRPPPAPPGKTTETIAGSIGAVATAAIVVAGVVGLKAVLGK